MSKNLILTFLFVILGFVLELHAEASSPQQCPEIFANSSTQTPQDPICMAKGRYKLVRTWGELHGTAPHQTVEWLSEIVNEGTLSIPVFNMIDQTQNFPWYYDANLVLFNRHFRYINEKILVDTLVAIRPYITISKSKTFSSQEIQQTLYTAFWLTPKTDDHYRSQKRMENSFASSNILNSFAEFKIEDKDPLDIDVDHLELFIRLDH